jgi:T4 RnlA family RNA ligase
MKQLHVQEYLRSGKTLDMLKAELGIEYSEKDNLIVLNYSQIDSPKIHPIVWECRGLILEKDTLSLVNMPFSRFFNWGEAGKVTESFDFSKAVGLEKLDGSLISVFNYKDKWMMSTRAVIENNSNVGLFDITFSELFYKTAEQYPNFWSGLGKKYCYCFELTAPENRVVTIYHDRKLSLILMRDLDTLKELPIKDLKKWSDKLGVGFPNVVTFKSADELIELARKLATLDEGFVSVIDSEYADDGISFRRVKVKNPSYVAILHLKDSAARSLRSFISLVRSNDTEEVLGYFPEMKPIVDKVKGAYEEYISKINQDIDKFISYFSIDNETKKLKRKEFAESALKCVNSNFMFQLYEGKVKDLEEYFSTIEKKNGRTYFEKRMVEWLKLKDIEFKIEE